MAKRLRTGVILLMAGFTLAGFQPPAGAVDDALQMVVVAPDSQHLAWAGANKLAQFSRKAGTPLTTKLADPAAPPDTRQAPDLLLLPLRSLATQVPALQVLELPFFYRDLKAVHRAIDGALGRRLKQAARQHGWEILAFWDEGMHSLSGNRRYNTRLNLTGMEFLLLRPDPMAEKQFLAFDAWPRRARARSRQQLLKECMVGSRSATSQQLWREQLHRVHLALSLSRHRYEGWVVAVPRSRWQTWSPQRQQQLHTVANKATRWQRRDAKQREQVAQQKIIDTGMRVYRLNGKQRTGFIERLPDWKALLPATLDETSKAQLIALAGAGATARINLHRPEKPLPDSQPTAPDS